MRLAARNETSFDVNTERKTFFELDGNLRGVLLRVSALLASLRAGENPQVPDAGFGAMVRYVHAHGLAHLLYSRNSASSVYQGRFGAT